jgi:transcriptional regulator with XRE-family HTH domain
MLDGIHGSVVEPFASMTKAPRSPLSVEEGATRLRLTREASGLNQAAWCRMVGISTQAWNNYEQAVNRISIDQALRVCAATGVTLDWIYRGISAGLPVKIATEIQELDRRERRKIA